MPDEVVTDVDPLAQRSLLGKVLDERDAAVAEYREFALPILAEARAFTADETVENARMEANVQALEARVDAVHAEVKRDKQIAKARRDAGLDIADDATITVNAEPRTYGEGSPNSYFADLCRVSPHLSSPDAAEAAARLARHASEVAVDIRTNPTAPESQRAKRQVQEAYRTSNGATARSALREMEVRADRASAAPELRTGMDTGAASGGSFVTPQYFVSDYAPYRQFGRVFIDQSNKQALPDYGMTVYIPSLSGPAGVGSQANQNSGIEEEDPTAGYLSNNLTTLAGQVTVSQQLLDRAGPNFAFDKMVFDQLQRAYAAQVDLYVIQQALANAGTVTAGSTYSTPYLYNKIGQAKAATVDAAGVVLPATHIFATPVRWESVAASTDTNGKPYVQPDYAGVFQALAAGGAGKPVPEGDTGYRVAGLPVFEDGNIPQVTGQPTQDQVIVAHMPEVWTWEGDLVPRVIPQTFAQNLSVLLQVYAYVTTIVRYPLAVQTIFGSTQVTPTFGG